MKLKQRVEDFRVRELLMEEPRKERDEFRVYRVTKRKLTSAELAREAGAVPADVSMAGLKDRQGVTIQHMALERGPVVSIKRPDLRIETVGWWPEALTPAHSEGNAFEIVVRALDQETLDTIRGGLGTLRGHNYRDLGGDNLALVNLEYSFDLGGKNRVLVFVDSGTAPKPNSCEILLSKRSCLWSAAKGTLGSGIGSIVGRR